jgi:hypothetical protein
VAAVPVASQTKYIYIYIYKGKCEGSKGGRNYDRADKNIKDCKGKREEGVKETNVR